jgi:CheY-like chemotaxis protein/nitrogen-specific signal transduction histidine kinase
MEAAKGREQLEEINRELVKAKEAAEAANLAKSQFLATISHEIRTPINGVLGMAELLMESRVTETQRRYVEALSSSGEALLHVVNDILDFSRMEAGKLKLETADFDVREITRSTVELLAERAHAKGLKMLTAIDADVPGAVSGDCGALRQVLVNLVGNGVKFTERGEVTLTVSRAPNGDSCAGGESCALRFVIRDTGIGIAPEARERLFTAFTQADGSHSRRFGGTGLGLVISKQLVELMGGAIEVESAPGKGSVFSFTVRFSPAENVAAPTAVAQPQSPVDAAPQQAAVCVLLVEDNKVNQEVCKAMLRRFGCEVDIAENGRLGVEAAFSRRYDLVLMDCQMPEMDGFEATATIRAREMQAAGEQSISGSTPRRLPIVALTANAMSGDRERCLAAGMDDYLSKPYNRQQLAELVGRWSRGAASQLGLAA